MSTSQPQTWTLTFSHCLSDNGVICTLDNPVYLTRIKGKTAHCLDRSARPRTITFDPTEYRFKLALLRNNHEEMLHIIRTSTLIGQSIIAYLQQKGFPEVNVHVFVQDCCLTGPGRRSHCTLFRTRIPSSTLLLNVEISMSHWRAQGRSTDQIVGSVWRSKRPNKETIK